MSCRIAAGPASGAGHRTGTPHAPGEGQKTIRALSVRHLAERDGYWRTDFPLGHLRVRGVSLSEEEP